MHSASGSGFRETGASPPGGHPAQGEAPRQPLNRLPALDALRGVAILGMVAFHLHWDLTAYNLVAPGAAAEFGWYLFGRVVTCLFLGLVGVNLVLATRHGLRPRHFLRRLALVVGASGLVSLGTWLAQPEAFVRFGILHCIALSSILALPLLRAPWWLVAMASIGLLAGREALVQPGSDVSGVTGLGLYFLGLVETTPWAPDYVPLFPWFGVVLIGLLAGRLLARYPDQPWARWEGAGRLAGGLRWAGRWSLPIYLVHQPLLIGMLSLALPWMPPAGPALAETFTARYAANCEADGGESGLCRRYAACVIDGLVDRAALLKAANRHSLEAEQVEAWQASVDRCANDLLVPNSKSR